MKKIPRVGPSVRRGNRGREALQMEPGLHGWLPLPVDERTVCLVRTLGLRTISTPVLYRS